MRIFTIAILIFLTSCLQVNNKRLKGNDYRLFNDTPLEALSQAVSQKDVPKIKQLAVQVDINYQEPKFGRTILMLAVRNNNYESAKTLLQAGANPNIHDHYDGTSAIIIASGHGVDTDLLKLLLKSGANPNDVEVGKRREGNTIRNTPLLAATGQSLEKVMLLLENGADVNQYTDMGYTAVGNALAMDKLDIALYLLEHGASITAPTREVENKKYTIADELRYMLYPLDSKNYKEKMKIVDLLRSKGVEYRSIPIPPYAVKQAKKHYPNDWKEYLEKY